MTDDEAVDATALRDQGSAAPDESAKQEAAVRWSQHVSELNAAHEKLAYSQAQLGAVKLALEFDGLTPPDKILRVVGRLVREVAVDTRDTEPTRLLVDAARIERGPR